MKLESLSPLSQRLIASALSLAIVFLTIYYSYTPPLSFLVPLVTLLIGGLAAGEYYKLAAVKGLLPRVKLGICLILIYIFAVFLFVDRPNSGLFPILGTLAAMPLVFASYFIRGKDPFENIAVTLFGFIYLAIPIACLIQIDYFFPLQGSQDGRWWVVYTLAITYLTDSAGFFVGKNLGRNKLAPFISPNKTWEGAVGGFLFAVLTSMVFAHFANREFSPISMKLSFLESIILGGILSILAQIGDLSESLLKRDAKVKDSSKIPGLGGMLDVIDSLIFTAPVVYLYLKFQNP